MPHIKKAHLTLVSCLLAAFVMLPLLLSSCKSTGGSDSGTDSPQSGDVKDYAAEVKLDIGGTATKKQEVTVHTFVDGDTTHFNVPETVMESGLFKARYIAINTPESTGKIEEWGKKASDFTKEKLSGATSIYIESDTAEWNADSTGGRYLVWVWYRTPNSSDYRNLNIEILQNGLAIASSSANNIYGSTCTAAIAQAKAQKLNIHSGKRDPDFYYGDAVELTLRELRLHVSDYNGKKVAFEGVITINNSNTVYVEDYDAESGIYFGMTVYYGYGLSGEGLEILSVGNRSRIVGTVQYYEAGDSWQVSGLTYRQMKPDDPGNIQKIGDGFAPAFVKLTPEEFISSEVEITDSDGKTGKHRLAELSVNTTVSMDGLKVVSVYTTDNTESSQFGAMTLTVEAGGSTFTVRTAVLRDSSGELITAKEYEGKTIGVRGMIDKYDGNYQIKVFTPSDITVAG
ncbi:MAG: thermonuclease family protein [Clostridia bacterium]|nr:thermonuclease family protein [Clostridia bacterium]